MAQQIVTHTSLRGIAALIVCWGHYSDVFARDVLGVNFYLPHTHLGVDLFFLLSGFILFHVYSAVFASGVTFAAWGGFMLRRLLRIYPLHVVTLLLVIVIARFELPPQGLWQLGLNLTLTQAWGFASEFYYNAPSWSISAEFAAYLAFPFMVVLAAGRAGRGALLLAALAAALVLYRMGGGGLGLDDIGRQHALLRVVMGFPVGVLIGWALKAGYTTMGRASLLQLVALAALAAGLYGGAAEIWLILPMVLLVFATARDEGVLGRLLSVAPLHWLGKVSYGIYLLQWPMMLVMFNIDPKVQPYLSDGQLHLARLAIFLALLFGAAALSWRLLEAPMQRRAHRFTVARRAAGRAAPQP